MTTLAHDLPPDIDLAELGDSIRAAQLDRAEKQAVEKRQARQRASDRRRLERAEGLIEVLETLIAERRPVVAKLERRLSKVEKELSERLADGRDGTVEILGMGASRERQRLKWQRQDLERALRQARETGSEEVRGEAVHQVGTGIAGFSPVSYRLSHQLLEEIAPAIDWTLPVEPLERDHAKLQAEVKALRGSLRA